MGIVAILCALSLLIGGVTLMPSSLKAADWISDADSYAASWVKDIEQELLKKDYRYVYANDPRTPQMIALRLLNQAARAQEANDNRLAQQLVQDALKVFEEGVRKLLFVIRDRADHDVYREHVPIKSS